MACPNDSTFASDDFTYRDALIDGPARGRGAGLNPGNRFENVRLHVLGEHLDALALEREAEKSTHKIATTILPDDTRKIINKVDDESCRDTPFHWTINPYRGCEHGCIYCYARPTHEMLGMSSGLDFETKIMAKFDAAKLLRKELAASKWQAQVIGIAGVTDCYQPIEADLKITRSILQVLAECRQPVGIITKNHLILRDLDLLCELAKYRAVNVSISITTLNNKLAAAMEPRASSPADRLATIQALSQAGIPTSVMTAPIIPGLTDKELPEILRQSAEAGAIAAGYVLLRLPWQVKDVFIDWVQRIAPERASHVESLIRQTRSGELYDSRPGVRMRGQGAIADQINNLFHVFAKRHGLDGPFPKLSNASFKQPITDGQLTLF